METQLKIKHAHAVRNKDAKEIERTEKELAALGIHGEWLSEDVLVWRDGRNVKSQEFYPDSKCSVCGNKIEKTGKPGRPPTKCLKHR